MKRQYFIGPFCKGQTPKNGATIKNNQFLDYLKKKGIEITAIDTDDWKRKPWILAVIFFTILTHPYSRYILAADSPSTYRLLKAIRLMPGKRQILYWVIGGSVANRIKDGTFKACVYGQVNWFLVEGNRMKQTLEECGFAGKVIVVPNFKEVSYIPQKDIADKSITKFVFLSRIIPEKGCDLILEAVRQLNEKYKSRFIVDFYGPVEQSYGKSFYKSADCLPNVNYKGFLYLFKKNDLDILASYDCMLFPTFWHGEGFPGIFIDSFVAGLPIIASDWNMNEDIIEDGVTGLICKTKDTESLKNAMERIILSSDLLHTLSGNCSKMAREYDTANVLTEELFRRIGILG